MLTSCTGDCDPYLWLAGPRIQIRVRTTDNGPANGRITDGWKTSDMDGKPVDGECAGIPDALPRACSCSTAASTMYQYFTDVPMFSPCGSPYRTISPRGFIITITYVHRLIHMPPATCCLPPILDISLFTYLSCCMLLQLTLDRFVLM